MTELIKYSADIDVSDFHEKYVDVEKYLSRCQECGSMGINWSCPPYDLNPNGIWNSYNKLKIILYKIEFDQETLDHTFRETN